MKTKNDKMEIRSHTFKGSDDYGYTYEITFNKSLGNTCRMNAMAKGLNRFDRWRTFWLKVNLFAELIGWNWLEKYSYKRF